MDTTRVDALYAFEMIQNCTWGLRCVQNFLQLISPDSEIPHRSVVSQKINISLRHHFFKMKKDLQTPNNAFNFFVNIASRIHEYGI